MLQQWQVPVTLDDTQQYLILNGILMTIKQKLREKKLVNLTWNKNNWNLYSEQNNGIPHFLQQHEKQGMKLNSLEANNFHTANGHEIHSL
jgi:RecJ-like exonuclease